MHRRATSLALSGALAAGLLAACGPSGDDDACSGLVAGDLVITEIMANPAGEDTGKEWIEIYNAGSASVDLGGVTVAASRADGTAEKLHTMRALSVAAGDYVVLGGVLDELKPAYVDYGYGSDLGSLLNAAGRVSLRCGANEVDRVEYGEMADGAAKGFTGASAPDSTQNDDPLLWCDATMAFEAGQNGSPGAANEVCPQVNPPGTCEEGGVMRATVPPGPGDLVITEVMPDPSATADDAGEWFEVVVVTAVDLNGLEIGKLLGDPDTVVSAAGCLRVNPGDRLIFAHSNDMVMNGGLPAVDVVFPAGKPGLSNSGGVLVLSVSGQLVDQITWASAKAGRSLALDPDATDAGQNDLAASFCDAALADVYGAGDKGTPGAANPQCPLVVPPGMCDDGGNVRAIVSPMAGQLEITELMPNPALVADASGEWFEVHATANVDLNGLQIGKAFPTVDGTVSSPTCLEVPAGGYAILARNLDPMVNGMLPAAIAPFSVSLPQTGPGLFVAVGGTLLDTVAYAASTSGTSIIVDADGTVCNAPAGTAAYNGTDIGTPAADNGAQCP